MYQKPFYLLAKQGLTGEQCRVLFYLFGKLNFDNYVLVTRQEVAEWIGIDPTNVSHAIRVLKDKNIVFEGPAVGKCKTYRLNPFAEYQGKD